jgi:proteasome accessory factor B
MNLYRGSFRRLLELDARIRGGRYPNCTTFAREWEVSAKTVQRDVEFLRDQLRAPIEYDPDRRGYFYTETSWRMPRLELTEGELFELAVAERMAAQYRGSPLADALESVFTKIRASLGGAVSIDPIDVKSGFSFHGHPVREVHEETWRAVAHAVRRGEVLRVTYRRFGAERPKTYDVEPVHLACLDGEWTLVGRLSGYSNLATLALSRVQRVKPTGRTAPRIDFDPGAYFANRFQRFVGQDGASHDVVVRFSRTAAEGVLERRWHAEQKVSRGRDGTVTISFPAPTLFEVQRWVLQWGGEVEVLGPPELRRAVAAEARAMVRTYRRGRD